MGDGAFDADAAHECMIAKIEFWDVVKHYHPSSGGANKAHKWKKRYDTNKTCAIGADCVCPVCGQHFLKKTKAQAFCHVKREGRSMCRDKYHNTVNPGRASRASKYR